MQTKRGDNITSAHHQRAAQERRLWRRNKALRFKIKIRFHTHYFHSFLYSYYFHSFIYSARLIHFLFGTIHHAVSAIQQVCSRGRVVKAVDGGSDDARVRSLPSSFLFLPLFFLHFFCTLILPRKSCDIVIGFRVGVCVPLGCAYHVRYGRASTQNARSIPPGGERHKLVSRVCVDH